VYLYSGSHDEPRRYGRILADLYHRSRSLHNDSFAVIFKCLAFQFLKKIAVSYSR